MRPPRTLCLALFASLSLCGLAASASSAVSPGSGEVAAAPLPTPTPDPQPLLDQVQQTVQETAQPVEEQIKQTQQTVDETVQPTQEQVKQVIKDVTDAAEDQVPPPPEPLEPVQEEVDKLTDPDKSTDKQPDPDKDKSPERQPEVRDGVRQPETSSISRPRSDRGQRSPNRSNSQRGSTRRESGVSRSPDGFSRPVNQLAALPGEGGASSGGRDGTNVVERLVEVLPGWLRNVLIGLVLILVLMAGAWYYSSRRARRLMVATEVLDRQRQALLDDVGLLQEALLPNVPDAWGQLKLSAGYRPAAGLGSGGDFYDLFELSDGRLAVVLGDISGHGKDAVGKSALMRYTLRAYLKTGLAPREALRVAGLVLDPEQELDGSFTTVILGIYDPEQHQLTYATAGHHAPLVLGGCQTRSVGGGSTPLGWGIPSGQRQTVIGFGGGCRAAFYTDGLTEAKRNGQMLGETRLLEMLRQQERPDAPAMISQVRAATDRADDDMALLILQSCAESPTPAYQREELVLEPGESLLAAERLLGDCGVASQQSEDYLQQLEAERDQARLLTVELREDSPAQLSVTLLEPNSMQLVAA